MASDRARISYDPTRAYRGVIAEQGRVTLEADVNEQATIETEALRLETIDIVGPAGTPDNGYEVTMSGTGASIGAGTYYLGGWRLTLDEAVSLSAQPEWLDASTANANANANANATRPSERINAKPAQGLVALLVTEQSVCAVEDQALREVALGGPDSAARSRLIQRFPLIPLEADNCADAAAQLETKLGEAGISIDPTSCELLNAARLQVGFVADPAPADPCTPAAAGGYLGADNQLIRVTVIEFDGTKQAGTLLWGRNNASILYRVTTTPNPATVLTLQGVPIDPEHSPAAGQAVEILRSRVELKDGTFTPAAMTDRNFIAADSGFVTTVAVPYDRDSGTLTLADALPSAYANDPNPLFLRLWDSTVPFQAGTATPLNAAMGVTVTLTLTALSTAIAARPFWRFAVRPDTPAEVYPVRYAEGPQPPDGPRQWIGDLAVVAVTGGQAQVIADCRPTFEPLTAERCACCALTLDPREVSARGGLQRVIDSFGSGPAVMTLKPGKYILERPLLLGAKTGDLVIEACGFGVTIAADPSPKTLKAFVFGLVILDQASAIALRRLNFEVPMVPSSDKGGTFSGVMIADSGLVTIEDCAFSLQTRIAKADGTIFGGAVTISGRAAELTVRNNRFVGETIIAGGIVCGVLAAVNSKAITTSLGGVVIEDNEFATLNAGIVAFARLGEVHCTANRMSAVNTGIFLADPVAGASNAFAKEALASVVAHPTIAQLVTAAYPAEFMASLATAPASDPPGAPSPKASLSRTARATLAKDMAATGRSAFAYIATPPAPAAGTPSAATGATAATRASPSNNTATAPAANKATHAQLLANIAKLDTIAVTAQALVERTPAILHIVNNDITLANTDPNAAPGIGIAVLRAPGDDPSTLVMSSNRVACGDRRTMGGSLAFVTVAAVTGNILTQPAAGNAQTPVFGSIGVKGGHYAFNGNLFITGAHILPPRTAPAPDPRDYWPFLNTES
jgi:hypothetical protein